MQPGMTGERLRRQTRVTAERRDVFRGEDTARSPLVDAPIEGQQVMQARHRRASRRNRRLGSGTGVPRPWLRITAAFTAPKYGVPSVTVTATSMRRPGRA